MTRRASSSYVKQKFTARVTIPVTPNGVTIIPGFPCAFVSGDAPLNRNIQGSVSLFFGFQDLAGLGVDLVVVFILTLVKFHIVVDDAVVPIQFGA